VAPRDIAQLGSADALGALGRGFESCYPDIMELNRRYFGKTIVFCLPGSRYSGRFLVRFTQLLLDCRQIGINTIISQDYSSMVNYARCKVIGANVTRGKYQVPFGGTIEYDYMMWIDSDIAFTSTDFFKLLEQDRDIVSGWYIQPGGLTPVVEKMDNEYFKSQGYFEFISEDAMSKRSSPFKVDYIGFGWVLIKQGVFESISYPWFAPKLIKIGEDLEDVCSEDVSFCIDAKNAGYDIWVDPKIRVGHEKVLTI
jgi:hypothetical protein